MDKLHILARNLRQNQTPQERKIWSILRNNKLQNLKFRRQYPIGNYIVDFVCKEIKVIIEIDGGQHNTTEGISADNKRTEFLKSKGYRILRFWNNDIDNNLDGVYESIVNFISEIEPSP